MLYSEIAGKKLISLADAKTIGEVSGVYINPETYAAEYISLNDDMHILSPAKIFGAGGVLTVAGTDALTDINEAKDYLFYNNGLSVVNVAGEVKGVSADLDFNAKKSDRGFTTDTGVFFRFKSIIAVSDNTIVVNPENRKLQPKERKPKTEKIIAEAKAGINFEEVSFTATAPITVASVARAETQISDYSFLIGRRVRYEVSDLTRTFVVKPGTVINEKVIEAARRAGKIVDLVIKSN